MSFADLPIEILVQQVMDLPTEEILRFCQVDPSINRLCQSSHLWTMLVRRDFPGVVISLGDDPRTLYFSLLEQRRAQAEAQLQRRSAGVRRLGPHNYWQALRPARRLLLTGAVNYVNRNYPNAQGANRFVYWPDYRIAGTVSDIVQVLNGMGADLVNVGEMHQLTQGQRGTPPGRYRLTEQLVYDNSFDPLDPQHVPLIEAINNRFAEEAQRERQLQTSLNREVRRLGGIDINGQANLYGYY